MSPIDSVKISAKESIDNATSNIRVESRAMTSRFVAGKVLCGNKMEPRMMMLMFRHAKRLKCCT
jgi:hypothetical protein